MLAMICLWTDMFYGQLKIYPSHLYLYAAEKKRFSSKQPQEGIRQLILSLSQNNPKFLNKDNSSSEHDLEVKLQPLQSHSSLNLDKCNQHNSHVPSNSGLFGCQIISNHVLQFPPKNDY